MTTTTLVSILIGVAVAALLVVRQLRAQPLNARFRLPLILGGSVVVAAAFGAARAATVHLWLQDGQPWRQGNWLAGSTILIYLAVTYTVQRLIMQARAQRLPAP